jgi:hypothetical protein
MLFGLRSTDRLLILAVIMQVAFTSTGSMACISDGSLTLLFLTTRRTPHVPSENYYDYQS